ncbi:MAG: SUMF1/EgtB/PvdO family nonheme iron enzyme [Verrucomicrobia bacterium]|nr:SUMF1/EgtB/PvdO family nonheme iron enzyme [Verrucomicrobiota bacterium]
MSSDIERWEPPNDAAAFESLCLDLWRDIWHDPSAQKHARRGQKQDGVDIFGRDHGALVGIQCKQKDGRLWAALTVRELETEVNAAKKFEPKLARFILATTAPRDAALQKRANQLTEEHRAKGLFTVEVWAWEDIWHELYLRFDLLQRIAHVYWPRRASLPPPPASLDDLVRGAHAYLEYLAPQCQRLPLIGLDPKSKDTPLTLDAVYTALDTQSSERAEDMAKPGGEKAKPLSALQAVARHSCFVLKGDPGSGKSTFLSYLSLCLAKHHLEPDGPWLKRLEGWPAEARWIPITVVLRDFVRALPEKLPEPNPRRFWDFFARTLEDAKLSACAAALETALDNGHAIVFLDGLDEVPTDVQRDYVRACVLKFAERFRRSRLVLTCRTLPYEAMRLEGVPDFELAPFDDGKIAAFITAWYTAHVPKPFSRDAADERRRGLTQAVQRPELRRLAGNPMLLTDMALLHTHRGRLPDDRAKLYKEVIELLLLRWDEAKAGSGLQDLLREAKRDENDLLRTLGAVAFAAHGRSRTLKPDETGDIQHHELLYALQELHPQKSLDWANRVVETVKERAGLLIAVEEHVFRFPHRSFQEYLAALHLTKDRHFGAAAVALLDETGYWREVIKWAAGRVTHVDDLIDWKGFDLLRTLCPNSIPPQPLPWHRVWLAGEALLEMSLAKVEQFDEGPELVRRIRGLLKQLIEQEALAPLERAQAAMALGWLGDDREGVGTRARPEKKEVPDLAWAAVIEPDEFIMGGPGEYEGELQFKHRIEHPFCVAKYPVTVAQYELFIQDGGYEREDLWTKAGWQRRESEQRKRPDDYAIAFQTPNHPRVGVSWYEAVAFCNWLNAAFSSDELKLPHKNWKVRLPSEAEWERAARHTDGREFPWDPQDKAAPPSRCNCRETSIRHTSAVGLFPSGAAVCQAHDMAGNAWEWCLTQWRQDYRSYEREADQNSAGDTARVLRGGSWYYDAVFARCAFRYRDWPDYRFDDVGFRVVASPFVSGR